MQIETALLIGVMFAAATWLVLQNSFVKILFGFLVLSNATNLLLLSLSGDPSGKTAPIAGAETATMVDPLPQALILTAIVIGFGVAAYLVVLLYRLFLDQKTANAAEMHDGPAEREPAEPGER